MTPTWRISVFVPDVGPLVPVYSVRYGDQIIDQCFCGIWRRRISWLPNWVPFNTWFDRSHDSISECVRRMIAWAERQNAIGAKP